MEDFIYFIQNITFDYFIRIFWFYLIFEFTRYVVLEQIVLIIWKIKSYFQKDKYIAAKNALWQQKPFVSIIVPGKNEGKHLYKLITSLKEQNYKNFELIVVNDGSDDQTEIIGKSYLNNGWIDKFYTNKERGGKASAANLALRFSKGQFIIHLDADCSYDSDAIEQILIPFYLYPNVGAVGGNVQVRNYNTSLATTMQGIEYQNVVGIGRIVTSELGIYKLVSGAFGAFRTDVLKRLGGWDIGPGLDGDITVKIRKLGYNIRFASNAMCITNAPNTFYNLGKQRRRWDKSLIRFRLRKHNDVFFPNANFRWSTFWGFVDNITFNLLLDIKWIFYAVDMAINNGYILPYIIALNYLLYTCTNYYKLMVFSLFRERKVANVSYFFIYVPLQVIYTGYFLRAVRTYAYFKELVFKESYKDPWNPQKSSHQAEQFGL